MICTYTLNSLWFINNANLNRSIVIEKLSLLLRKRNHCWEAKWPKPKEIFRKNIQLCRIPEDDMLKISCGLSVTTSTENTPYLEIWRSGENQVTHWVSTVSLLAQESTPVFVRWMGNKNLVTWIRPLSWSLSWKSSLLPPQERGGGSWGCSPLSRSCILSLSILETV